MLMSFWGHVTLMEEHRAQKVRVKARSWLREHVRYPLKDVGPECRVVAPPTLCPKTQV